MLYNKRWERPQTTQDSFSLENLIAWLEKHPADQAYNFYDCQGGCLIDQYLGKRTTAEEYRNVPFLFRGTIAATSPYTFGAALERAKYVLKSC